MLPNDINRLVSFLNTKLRDDDMSLAQILEINDANEIEIMELLDVNGYYFDEVKKRAAYITLSNDEEGIYECLKMLSEKGIEDYKIVAFSVDPEVDTPDKLQEYLGNYDVIDESKWELLTGYSQEHIASFAADSFKTLVKDDPNNNQVIHGTSFYLVDQNGVVVKNYSGNTDVPKEEIVIDVETLIEDGK